MDLLYIILQNLNTCEKICRNHLVFGHFPETLLGLLLNMKLPDACWCKNFYESQFSLDNNRQDKKHYLQFFMLSISCIYFQSSDAAISYKSVTINENSSGIYSPDGHNAVQLNSYDSGGRLCCFYSHIIFFTHMLTVIKPTFIYCLVGIH